ncbi:hypothetical protein, partial [Bosea sp. (in: a-proteobacteria)]|uniref:hypothetical protein n=1 Tax=Bosea sp. (in: a-proteobacteria) TaxID=1871050 RepID=UPI0035681D5A
QRIDLAHRAVCSCCATIRAASLSAAIRLSGLASIAKRFAVKGIAASARMGLSLSPIAPLRVSGQRLEVTPSPVDEVSRFCE